MITSCLLIKLKKEKILCSVPLCNYKILPVKIIINWYIWNSCFTAPCYLFYKACKKKKKSFFMSEEYQSFPFWVLHVKDVTDILLFPTVHSVIYLIWHSFPPAPRYYWWVERDDYHAAIGTSSDETLKRKIKGRCEEMLHLTLDRALCKELWLIDTSPINSDPEWMIIASVPSLELNYFKTAQKLLRGVSLKTYKNIFFYIAKYNSYPHKLNRREFGFISQPSSAPGTPKQLDLNYGKHWLCSECISSTMLHRILCIRTHFANGRKC